LCRCGRIATGSPAGSAAAGIPALIPIAGVAGMIHDDDIDAEVI
jgi:hypothetical protein